MKQKILLNYNENTKIVEEEESSKFIKNILLSMGIPVDEFWQNDILNFEQKITLRKYLLAYNVKIIDDLDGHIQIYFEDKLVGEWLKPIYFLRRDLREINPKKQLYLEMEINYTTVFDESE